VLNPNQRRALDLLAQHEVATLGSATDEVEGQPVVHPETAVVLYSMGFIERDARTIRITPKGLAKAGRTPRENPAQRRRRRAAESLRAQAVGEWRPAKAGDSARASRTDADQRASWKEVHELIAQEGSELDFDREWLSWAQKSNLPDEIACTRRQIEGRERQLKRLQAELDALHQRKAA